MPGSFGEFIQARRLDFRYLVGQPRSALAGGGWRVAQLALASIQAARNLARCGTIPGFVGLCMMSVEVATTALSRFMEASRVRARLAIMPVLHAEMAVAESTFEPVLEALDGDKPLSDFIRHAACSTYFGGNNSRCTLSEAFARMGVTEFYRLVSTAVIHTRMANAAAPGFVAHADQVARLCELIASHAAKDLAVDAYFTGLCHDAAVPTMSESLADFQYFADQATSNDPGVLPLEIECNEFTHCDAGAEIVKAMGFAPAVATAVKYHHEPQRLLDLSGDAARLLAMVVVAERVIAVSLEQSASVFIATTEGEIQQSCGQALDLSTNQLQTLSIEMLELCRVRRKLS